VKESANLDLVRSICAAWEHGDWSAAGWAHPEMEFVIADGPNRGSWTGQGNISKATRDLLDTWHDIRIKVEEYREVDDKRVLVLNHFAGRGKTSGLELDQMGVKAAFLFHLLGGRVKRVVYYTDRATALADLGLASEAGSASS
jgi:ketosteroid isomerase-like protein